jgi:cytoskeletal protein CcmA (bactofilin family)
MVKTRYRQWFTITLPGLILMAVLFIYGGGWPGSIPVALASGTGTNLRDNGCTTNLHSPDFGGSIIVNNNEVACGTVMDFGGKVDINGEMHGKMTVFGSSVVIAGTMTGDVDLYSGVLTLQSGSHMHGDIHLYGSHLIQTTGSHFNGHIINRTDRIDWLIGNGGFSFPTWSILIWVALGLLLTRLLPEHVMFVRATVVHKVKRSFVIGLLSILLAPAVMVVLVALILPIPVAILVALGVIAAWALGTAAIGWLLGEQMVRAVAPQWNTRPVQVAIGLVALALLGSLPYIGWLINLAVGLVGLGAVFLSRFGTRLYSQPKEPISL